MFELEKVSGIAYLGATPYLVTRATNMSHWPPSPIGSASIWCTVRSSSARSASSIIEVRNQLAFSSLSQKCRWAWLNWKSGSRSSRSMTPLRNRLRPLNSQHRPDFFWLAACQLSTRFETVGSVEATTDRSRLSVSTLVVATAFWATRAVGSAAKRSVSAVMVSWSMAGFCVFTAPG